MSAQGAMNSLTSSVLGGLQSVAKVASEGVDAMMAKKADSTLKQKLSTRKQIKNKASQRMGKIGGNK